MTLHPLTHSTALCTDLHAPHNPCSFRELEALSAQAVNLHTPPADGLTVVTEAQLAEQDEDFAWQQWCVDVAGWTAR